MARLAEHSLSPICGNAWRILAGVDLAHPVFQYPGNLVGRLTPSLIERWELGDDGLFEGADHLGGGGQQVSRRRDDAICAAALGATRGAGAGGGVHRLELIHAFGRRRGLALVLQRTVDQGRRQHRHRPGHVAGAGGALRDPAFRAVLASGHRCRQMGCERRHPRSRTVRAARVAVTTAICPVAGAPTASSRCTGAPR